MSNPATAPPVLDYCSGPRAAGAPPLPWAGETCLYQDGDVLVSETRLTMGWRTYIIEDLAQLELMSVRELRWLPSLGAVLGTIMVICGLVRLAVDDLFVGPEAAVVALVVGAPLAVAGVLARVLGGPTDHALTVIARNGSFEVLWDRDLQRLRRIKRTVEQLVDRRRPQ